MIMRGKGRPTGGHGAIGRVTRCAQTRTAASPVTKNYEGELLRVHEEDEREEEHTEEADSRSAYGGHGKAPRSEAVLIIETIVTAEYSPNSGMRLLRRPALEFWRMPPMRRLTPRENGPMYSEVRGSTSLKGQT